MNYSEEKFKEHIKAVVTASQSSDDTLEERPLTLSELKELAISMGMTEEEWNELQKKAHEHLKAADDHLKARNFREAITEADKATAINPYIKNSNAVLAKAYLMLWLETHEDEHRDKAEFHARRELKVDPRDQIAVNVLSTIDKKRRILAGDKNDLKRIFLIVGGILILVFVGVFISNSLNRNEDESPKESLNIEQDDRIKNDLIIAEEEVIAQWDMVQSAIDRRNNLVPDLISAINTSNVESAALVRTIEELQDKIKTAEGEEKFRLENNLNETIQEAKLIAEEDNGSENVKNLMYQIETSENRIMYEKKKYNDKVKRYNILVKQHKDKYPEYEVKPYFNDN